MLTPLHSLILTLRFMQTEVSASPTFFGWVFGFNGKVQILAPESVKEQYRQMIAQADEDMQESE